jgi:hypothetical protein
MKRISAICLVILALSACSTQRSQRGSLADLSQASAHGLEVEATPEEQARDEVMSTPTEFEVSIEHDRYAWERARFFLEKYSSPDSETHNPVVKIVGSRRGLASPPTNGSYSYEVFKDFHPDGYRYSVQCIPGPGGEIRQALLNASNFARFIRDGKLEVSLLSQ